MELVFTLYSLTQQLRTNTYSSSAQQVDEFELFPTYWKKKTHGAPAIFHQRSLIEKIERTPTHPVVQAVPNVYSRGDRGYTSFGHGAISTPYIYF